MDRIDQAFDKFDRTGFMPKETRRMASVDMAVPIGYGQTISQPTTVEMMLRWLAAQPGDKVLDVGSGSGWTSALLSHIVGSKGRVYAVERIPELLRFGQINCEAAGVENVRFYQATEEYGVPRYAPYDRILVSASADKIPKELLGQLKPGGKMVIPVHSDILEISKDQQNITKIIRHPGFVFVPLISSLHLLY